MKHQSILTLGGICALLASPACSDDERDPTIRPRASGILELRWSIDGQTTAAACESLGATAFEVLIFDEGYFVAEREIPCADFETSLELFVDDYVARTTLVNAYDFPVTRRIVEDFFQVNEDAVTRLAIDFPSNSAPALTDAGAPADAAAPLSDAGTADGTLSP